MIDNLIHFSIRNKIIIGFLTLALVAWGIFSLSRLPVDAVPDITNNQVQVITLTPTLAAQEVEQLITFPVELSMATLPDLVEIRSISRFGLSVVTIVFKDDVEIYHARQLVLERVGQAATIIPQEFGKPEVAPVTTGLGEIYQYVLHPKPGYEKKYDAMELRTIQDWLVKRQLLGTPGVADVSSFGGFVKQYEVTVDPQRLRDLGVSIADVFTALHENNSNTGGAYIEKAQNAYFIRGIGLVKGMEDVENILVKNNNGFPVLIRDVGKVGLGHAVRYGAMTRNNDGEVVGGIVLMLKGENSADVIANVKERIVTIQKSLPEGVEIEAFLDRSRLIDKAIHTVSKNLVEGGLIVVFILVLLLGNLRAGLVVASVIPLAMLFAISLMNLFGVSGNLMSLGAIDFGLIVDGAVIIVESIVHRIHMTAGAGNRRLDRNEMDEVVLDASIKIRKSAAFGEIIILIVYLPILALTGVEGKMFKPMAQTVSFAILGAFILSMTYVPVMSSLFLSRKVSSRESFADRIIRRLNGIYQPLLEKVLSRKLLVVGTAVGLMIVSLMIFNSLGGQFIPTLEEGDFAVETRLPPGSSLSQTVQTTQKASALLLKQFPEIKEIVGKVGTSEIPTDPMPLESCDLIIVLKDKKDWVSASDREELAEKMKSALEVLPGVDFDFQQPIQMRFNELMTGAKQDIVLKIYGEDMEMLAAKAERAAALIKHVQGVGDLFVEKVEGLPQIVIEYNRLKLAQLGLSVNKVNMLVNAAFAGAVAGNVYEGERRFDLVVRVPVASKSDIQDIKNLLIPLDNGVQLPLSQLAKVDFKEGPMQISREDTKRRITVGINVRNRDAESLVNEVSSILSEKLKLPAGYYITYGGQFENLVAAKERLQMVVPVALALIFVLLFFTFNSVNQALLIFSAIPFAAIGGVFALWLRDMPFSISAGIGFIALSGVAVLNGIVLIGFFNHLKADGVEDVVQRIKTGTSERLRPVLMTAAVASLGFLPMALSGSEGAEVQKPLATVVIGGLITSTLLTLFVIPVIYGWLESGKSLLKSGIFPSVIIVFFLVLAPDPASAQGKPLPVLTLNEAIKTVVENNPGIEAAELEIENQKMLKRTSFDLGRTSLLVDYGQFNSILNDKAFNVSQGFEFPTVYANTARVADQQIAGSALGLVISKANLIREVKIVYSNIWLSKERLSIYKLQDSLYKTFNAMADLRFKTGETAYLEKLAAEARVMEASNSLYHATVDLDIYKGQLKRLLKNAGDFEIEDGNYIDRFNVPADTLQPDQNPQLNYLKQQIELHKAVLRLENSRLLPDFRIGFITQTLRGPQNINGEEKYFNKNYYFNYASIGIGVPLWFRPQRARVKSARIRMEIAGLNFENEKLLTQIQYTSLTEKYKKLSINLNYFKQKALPHADVMISFAQKSFEEGEIGYLEYLQNLTDALQIRLNYYALVKEINDVSVNLEYLAGLNK